MTKLEYLEIIRAIETVEINERLTTKEYIELNPDDEEKAINEVSLILYGLMRAKHEIEKRCKGMIKNEK